MTTRLDFGCAFEKHDGWMGFDKIDYGQTYVGDVLDGLAVLRRALRRDRGAPQPPDDQVR